MTALMTAQEAMELAAQVRRNTRQPDVITLCDYVLATAVTSVTKPVVTPVVTGDVDKVTHNQGRHGPAPVRDRAEYMRVYRARAAKGSHAP